jgi:hypothetical protein
VDVNSSLRAIANLRRKLRAVAAVARDPAATGPERAAARGFEARLRRRLATLGSPAGDWSDSLYRLGRWARDIGKPAAPAAGEDDWTRTAHRVGKALRRGYKSWRSD